MAKAGLVAASTFSPVTLIFFWGGGVSKKKELNIRSVKSGPPSVATNSNIPAQNLPNSQINAADTIEAAACNLNETGDATINVNVPITPAVPSNYNYPTLNPAREPSLPRLRSFKGYPLETNRMVIAYHRPHNLKNLLFPRTLKEPDNKPVSSLIPAPMATGT
jgi:hypothetical protein